MRMVDIWHHACVRYVVMTVLPRLRLLKRHYLMSRRYHQQQEKKILAQQDFTTKSHFTTTPVMWQHTHTHTHIHIYIIYIYIHNIYIYIFATLREFDISIDPHVSTYSLPVKTGDFPLFPINNGDFPINDDDFPIDNGNCLVSKMVIFL